MIADIDTDALVGKPGPASKLLGCIAARYRLSTVERHGKPWCPIGRADLLWDSKLSLAQYHRALRTLRTMRLVTDQMAYFKAVRMPHFALGVQLTAFQGGDTATLEGTELQTAAIQGGEIATYTRASAGAGLVSKKESKKEEEVSKTGAHSLASGEGGDLVKAMMGKTVAEILAASKAGPPKTGKVDLSAVWQEAYHTAFKCFVPGLTLKERGQLKHFANACPAGSAAAVLRYAIGEWTLMAHTAAADNGAFSLPTKPNVGFLLKHVGVAVNLWIASSKPKAVFVPTVQPVQPIAKPAAQPVSDKATLAELMKILSD
jgi:hypothetical protein